MLAAGHAHDLKTVFIVAPTTPEARIPKITAAATGFIYYVSREGVTASATKWPAAFPRRWRASGRTPRFRWWSASAFRSGIR